MRKMLLFLLAAVLLAGCSTAQTTSTATPASGAAPTAVPAGSPTPDMAGAEIKDMPIDSVEVQIRESQPVQVAVLVTGSLSDKCTTFHEATQVRNGNTIELTITTMRPKDAMCAQMIVTYSNTFPLEGDFPPGDYIVRVNGVEKSFKI
jgi:hypothetical protein